MREACVLLVLMLVATVALADRERATEEPTREEPPSESRDVPSEPTAEPSTEPPGAKRISGMSILGNQEAPKSLVIVPWKSSQIGDSLGISTLLDDSRKPVDREVFLRALQYYEIRSERKP